MKLQTLLEADIDYEKGIHRVMGDQELYEQILGMFLEEDTLARAQAAFDAHDYVALFDVAHETKGFSGNADMTRLFSACCALVDLVRKPPYDDAAINAAFADFANAYQLTYDCVRRASE